MSLKKGETMNIPYDPADGESFWNAIEKLPGYPKNERMPIKKMLFESNALYQTTEVLKYVGANLSQPLFLVIDQTPMQRKGADLKQLVLATLKKDGWQVVPVIMKPDNTGQVHTDMPHIQAVKASLRPGCAVLALGSGVVTDIAKHACYLYQQETGISLPFVVFQTANSVSAFTSSNAPVFVDGVKRTLTSRYPDALICDLETLCAAPVEMTVAGVGDMLAGFVSLPDWYLAHSLGMDPGYTEFAGRLLGPVDQVFLEYADEIKRGTPQSMSILAKIIALGGLVMSLSHATTPMSGFEHVMSHVLDLQFEMAQLPLPQHGSQVALATIAGLEVYRHFLSEFDPAALDVDACYPSADVMRRQIEQNYRIIDPSGKAGSECWADYVQKLETWHAHRPDFEAALQNWSSLRSRLEQDICPAERIVQILKAIGAPLTWAQLTPPAAEENARFAFLNASLMRKRLTIGDLLIFTHWDREALWNEIVKRSQEMIG
jgi:glycerol-1-phosphate dehydrogenase [NAD(P)+]